MNDYLRVREESQILNIFHMSWVPKLVFLLHFLVHDQGRSPVVRISLLIKSQILNKPRPTLKSLISTKRVQFMIKSSKRRFHSKFSCLTYLYYFFSLIYFFSIKVNNIIFEIFLKRHFWELRFCILCSYKYQNPNPKICLKNRSFNLIFSA